MMSSITAPIGLDVNPGGETVVKKVTPLVAKPETRPFKGSNESVIWTKSACDRSLLSVRSEAPSSTHVAM